jgi:drug/metabolite transporter (DMT)-like permease
MPHFPSPELSLAVPVANASTFLFTAIVGHFLGEEKINKGKWWLVGIDFK